MIDLKIYLGQTYILRFSDFCFRTNLGLEFLNDKNGTIHNVPSRQAMLSCDSSVFVCVLFCFVFCVCV